MEANWTKKVPIRGQQTTFTTTKASERHRLSEIESTLRLSIDSKRRQKSNNKGKFMMMMMTIIPTLLALSLFALGANASLFSAFSFSGSKSEQPQTTTTTTTATATGINNNNQQQQQQQQLDLNSSQSVGDLVAIGAISLLDSPSMATSISASSPVLTTELTTLDDEQNNKNKLDYIIDFMRANKLTKFCDLITSKEAPIRQLIRQLNGLQQFTLFVPTNEALLLMASGQLEQIKRQPELLRQFLASHATDELVVPRAGSGIGARRPTSLVSLSGGQLRVVTASTAASPIATSLVNGQQTKLELIVNGANVLSGNSYALQEPNNNKVTYAIVHLIDRVLYPMPNGRLLDKVRSLAPRMARYFEMANSDGQLREALAGASDGARDTGSLWTLFLPKDDAFEATPAKLLDKLESNRTFLIEFLRGHLIDGLYFSNQLALVASTGTSRQQQQPMVKLVSLSGKLLEIESKTIQARTLVLINSTPLLEPDIMATNGVVHLVSRPILERHLADDCNCGTNSADSTGTNLNFNDNKLFSSARVQNSPVVTYEFDNRAASSNTNWDRKPPTKLDDSSSSVHYSAIAAAVAPVAPESNHLAEVEREESRSIVAEKQSRERVRSQRSGALLVERNNRDFYRPSTAPVNLLADDRLGQQTSGAVSALDIPRKQQQQQDPSDVMERYKIVLNATTRQRLRDELQRTDPTNQTNSFAYDRPMMNGGSSTPPAIDIGTTPSSFLLRRPYTPTPRATGAAIVPEITNQNGTSSSQQDQLASSSISRQQQMIKFQPEDARYPAASSNNRLSPSDSFARNSLLQTAVDDRIRNQDQFTGKTVPPTSGIKSTNNNCAFYDTDCRRILGKLVRLPPVRNRSNQQQLSSDSHHAKSSLSSIVLMQASGSNHTSTRTSLPVRLSASDQQHLDSTFGETETSLNNNSSSSLARGFVQSSLNRPQIVGPVNRLTATSSLNQPLPPWSSNDEGDQKRANGQWRGPATIESPMGADIARIKGPTNGFSSVMNRLPNQPSSINNNGQAVAEILLLPVKIFQEPSSGVKSNLSIQSNSFIERPQQVASTPFASNNNRQFHTPTPYSVSIMTTHMPLIFNNNNNHLGRPTNFTAFEYLPEESPTIQSGSNGNNKQVRFESASSGNRTIGRPKTSASSLRSPSAFRRQRIQQQQPSDSLETPQQIGRKANRVQQQLGLDELAPGDMSITSAKLTNISGSSNPSGGGGSGLLATQASNVSTNFIRSVAVLPQTLPSSSLGTSDFFQDRTIAEIMDDSGLRIDGQQVTFSRLKECLQDANLLNLVSQSDNSLTIFMPTDMAFQRLIQQQALLHQQRQREARNSGSSSLVSSLGQQHQLLPLMARSNRRPSAAAAAAALTSADSMELESSSFSGGGLFANVGDRLTLDCGSTQVRKLLLDHLSTRLIQPKQLTVDTSITSLNGHQLLLSSVPSKKIVVVDGQPVIAATRAKNGMVYVVNKFLNLTQQMPNVLELMESQPNLTTFLSYLSFSSMSDRLKRETGPLTILAPTNEAFEQLTPAARQLINSDPAALADILRGHIVDGAQFGKLIPMRSQLKTMNSDQSIEAKVIKPNVYLLDNQMTSMRLVGTTGNGVVNSIDRLIVPAWLKLSMGSSKPQSSTSLETIQALPGTRVRQQQPAGGGSGGVGLNLPTITNQPLRFEQPTNRFTAPSGRDSFLLDSSSGSLNNNLLSTNFEASVDPPLRSPFARLPNDLGENHSNNLRVANFSSSTSSKNMQLIEKLSQLMQARKFVKYLLRSGVSEKLKPDMNYVILVPTDQAIEKLPNQIIDLLERDRERLADLINYHVLDTTFEYINTIPDGQTLQTLNEKDILFNWHRNNTILTASGAVVMGGIQEENIALLIVDRVLYPTPGDILNIISKSPILSNFTSLVRNAGLDKQLSLAGPFTLFAPSDFAFNQLTKSDLDQLGRNKETARRFLLRHLSQPAIFTSSIALSNSTSSPVRQQQQPQQNVPQMMITNSLGEELTLRQRNDYFSVNEVNFSYADVAATNGVVHVIDGLL